LSGPEILFWTACDEQVLPGCAALKQLTSDSGETESSASFTAARLGITKATLSADL
jgi:hypothetical protein